MESFFSFLEKRVDDCSSLLCIGLDPHVNDLSAPTAASARDFCLNLVKQTSRYAAAFKPNAAFFEVFGADGWTALKDVITAIQEESNRMGSMIPVILDAKRGDVPSTAKAYAKSAFENLDAHCITINSYLGKDSIEPFIQNPEKGIFLLCKTSNPSSGEFQDLIVDGRQWTTDSPQSMPLYEYVARSAESWNVNNNIGLVVGATYLDAMKRIRVATPGLWFLSPGIGAQGGELEQVVKSGLRKDGKGILLPMSRTISQSDSPRQRAAEIRDEILVIRDQINRQRD
jgi:uridine monophosphate synthetase